MNKRLAVVCDDFENKGVGEVKNFQKCYMEYLSYLGLCVDEHVLNGFVHFVCNIKSKAELDFCVCFLQRRINMPQKLQNACLEVIYNCSVENQLEREQYKKLQFVLQNANIITDVKQVSPQYIIEKADKILFFTLKKQNDNLQKFINLALGKQKQVEVINIYNIKTPF